MSDTGTDGTERPECYHYDCGERATRIHHDKVRESPPAPCCDEHEPMYATKMWTPVDQPQGTLGGFDTTSTGSEQADGPE